TERIHPIGVALQDLGGLLRLDRDAGRRGRLFLAEASGLAPARFGVEYRLGLARRRAIDGPDPDRAIQTGGEEVLAVRGDGQAGDLVRVAVEAADRRHVRGLPFLAALEVELRRRLGQVPDEDLAELVGGGEAASGAEERHARRPRALEGELEANLRLAGV